MSPCHSNSTKVHCFGLTRQLLFLVVSEIYCVFRFTLITARYQFRSSTKSLVSSTNGSKFVLFGVLSCSSLWHSSFLSSMGGGSITLAVLLT